VREPPDPGRGGRLHRRGRHPGPPEKGSLSRPRGHSSRASSGVGGRPPESSPRRQRTGPGSHRRSPSAGPPGPGRGRRGLRRHRGHPPGQGARHPRPRCRRARRRRAQAAPRVRLGVAITGHEQLGLTVVVTEAVRPDGDREPDLRAAREVPGRRVSVNGATQIPRRRHAPGDRHPDGRPAGSAALVGRRTSAWPSAARSGHPHAALRAPREVVELPPELREVESGARSAC